MGFEQRITRRALMRLSSRMLIGTTVSGLFATPSAVDAEPYALRSAWEQRDISLTDSPIISPPLRCDFPFNALESWWDCDLPPDSSLDFFIRTRAEGAEWGDWIHLHSDDHARDDADRETSRDLVIVSPASQLQYRIEATANRANALPTLQAFVLTAVNTIDDGLAPVEAQAVSGATVKIIPRSGWGADERLRFDKKNKEIWPPEYRPIQKVVIHHTVTDDPDPTPSATVRAIYQYHAVARGWGDIGYNYLIDPNGTIYEGRYGGSGVVGGHTYGYNNGSMGISMLGTYVNHTITDGARAALKALIRAKAGDLDPLGKSFFVDRENVWNISGHRALTMTDCPGNRFYLTLNNLRREIKGLALWTGDPHTDPLAANPADASNTSPTALPRTAQAAPTESVQAVLQGVAWSATTFYSGELLTVRCTIKNSGTTALPDGKPAPTLLYAEDETYAKKEPAPKGALRIAIGPAAKRDDLPYRWGIGRAIDPGETVTVPVYVRLRTPQKTLFVATLLREGYGALATNDPMTLTVVPNPADPVKADPAKESRYIAETKHNLAGAFRTYWEANGGSERFGFPITESFQEKNPDDGKRYTMQYFERARFELHPEKDGSVVLGRLGTLVTRDRTSEQPFKPVAAVTDSATRRYFPEVGHTLNALFKTYWDAYGGLAIFGFPISEPFNEKSATDGKTYQVQYFERNRFEYHPENAGRAGEVALGLLGSEVLRGRGWLE